MSRSTRGWVVFAACNVVVALALIWTTRVVVELERSELRARAEKQLGAQFDLRLFHDRVLSSGPVSMKVLGDNIELWIEQQRPDK